MGECDFVLLGAAHIRGFIGRKHSLSGYLEEIGPLSSPLISLTLSNCTLGKQLVSAYDTASS